MKKIHFFYLIIIIVFVGCSPEFKPSGEVPDLESPIEEVFADTIGDMTSNIKLVFSEESCRSISASYGDDDEIYYQIIWINKEATDKNDCIEKYIVQKFENLKKVGQNKNGFDYYYENDGIYMVTWSKNEYIFFMKCKKDYIDMAVSFSNYLEEK